MNNFLLTIAGILVVVLTALFAVPPMINWNDWRGTFEEEASRLLDREVRVRGDVSVRLLPVPYVSFEKVRIADAPGVPGSFARAEQFKMWLAVPPLLRGAIEARQIELDKPVIRLRTEADGSGNWRKLQISESNLAYMPTSVALDSVRINEGTLLFEAHEGHEISSLTGISGEMSAASLSGPFKFTGSMALGGDTQQVRLATARMDPKGEMRFRTSVRRADDSTAHTINGTLFDLLGKAKVSGRLISSVKGGKKPARRAGYELTADVNLDASALTFKNVAISFQNKDRQQTLNGSAATHWREGLVTNTRLHAKWLDLDAIAGTEPGDGPLDVIKRLMTREMDPLGTGVTSIEVSIDQANLASTSIGDLTGRMVRRDGVTKIEDLRASLPGLSAIALDGFLENRKSGFHFDGDLLLRSGSFAELAQWAKLDLDMGARRALAAPLTVAGNVRLRPQSFELSEARVNLADTLAEGGFAYDWSKQPALVATFDADRISLARVDRNLLAPAQIARFLGLGGQKARVAANDDKPDGVSIASWLRDTDVTLRLRASEISDGTHVLTNVDADFGRTKTALNLTKFDVTWMPGLDVRLTGRLEGLKDAAHGRITGSVSAANAAAGEHLLELLGLAAGRKLPASAIRGRTPLRLAVIADIAKPGDGAAQAPASQLVADGLIGGDRVRIDARSFGRFDQWLNNPAEVDAQISGSNALAATRWLLGRPLGDAAEPTNRAKGKAAPATIVMTAAGTPGKAMKSFVRIDAGPFLDADFSGEVRLADDATLSAAWSGELELNQATTTNLALLGWPAIAGHIDNMPVKGRIVVASLADGFRFEPSGMTFGKAQLTGKLELTAGGDKAGNAPKISGDVALSSADGPALMKMLMRGGAIQSAGQSAGQNAPKSSDAAESTSVWPDTPFDFQHLAGVTLDLGVKAGRLTLDDRGNRLSNASMRIVSSDGTVAVNDFSGRAQSGTVTGSGRLVKSLSGANFNARLAGTGIELGTWAPELAKAKRLAGSARFEVDLSGQALSPRSLVSMLAGRGEFRLSAASVPGISAEEATAAARKVIDAELEVEALLQHLTEAVSQGSVRLGAPVLKVRIANGTMSFPSLVFDLKQGGLKNATFIDLAQWRIDSQWTVTPAPQPRPDNPAESVPLPPISIVYAGEIAEIAKIEPKIDLGDLERELVVRKMEANVARLERLRREDEARAAAERERLRQIEEEQRRAIEEEQRRRQQGSQGAAPTGQLSGQSATWPPGRIRPPSPEPVQPPTLRQ